MAEASTGQPKCQPCAVSQPRTRSRSAWCAVSTHSAVTVSPSACASRTSASTILSAPTLAVSSSRHAADERAGQLQRVHRQLAQVGEVGVAGAEVVDGDPHARARPAGAARRSGSPVVAHHRALGQLQLQQVRRQPGLGQDRGHVVDEPGSRDLPRRQVDADEQPRPRELARRHRLALRGRSASTQRPSGTISPVSSASPMNRSGPSSAELRVLPAHQRLDAAHDAVGQPHDRLVVARELAPLQRAGQRGGQRRAGRRRVRCAPGRSSAQRPRRRRPWPSTAWCRPPASGRRRRRRRPGARPRRCWPTRASWWPPSRTGSATAVSAVSRDARSARSGAGASPRPASRTRRRPSGPPGARPGLAPASRSRDGDQQLVADVVAEACR